MLTTEQRIAVAQEARSWVGTRYHSNQHVKGVGVDCGWLLADVYAAVNVIAPIDLGYYAREWHLHHETPSVAGMPEQKKEEFYVEWLQQFCNDITGAEPQAGDIGLWKFGLCWSHGGIFVSSTALVHAYVRHGVMLSRLREAPLAGRDLRLWSVR
jgi:cell wall-associated NlpC family hydrolase